MNHRDMMNLIDQLHAEWAEFGRMLEERGRRLELRHYGCEGGAASLHLVDINTDVEIEVDESSDSWN